MRGTGSGSTEIYWSKREKTVFRKYLQEACFVPTISGNLQEFTGESNLGLLYSNSLLVKRQRGCKREPEGATGREGEGGRRRSKECPALQSSRDIVGVRILGGCLSGLREELGGALNALEFL